MIRKHYVDRTFIQSSQEMRDDLGLDSLHYLSIEGLVKATGIEKKGEGFCMACFDGKYSVNIDASLTEGSLEG